MSRAFAPAEQGEPEDKAEVQDFKAYLAALHSLRNASSDQQFWDRTIPFPETHN